MEPVVEIPQTFMFDFEIDMEPVIEIPNIVSVCKTQASASCDSRFRIAGSSMQGKSQETAATLNDESALAPIDLAVALESACWDFDFLVCCFTYFFVRLICATLVSPVPAID